jgi:hypothetical protein
MKAEPSVKRIRWQQLWPLQVIGDSSPERFR